MTTNDKNSMQEDGLAQAWPLRRVGLKVRDLDTSLEYYTGLGFSIVRDQHAEGAVGLGSGSQEILSLRVLPGGRPRPPRTAGLYHFAILLSDETELGSFLQHSLERRIQLAGASDHLVSQAIYLSDPEGNGIEVYADRPREQWEWKRGQIEMATLPLDAQALLKQVRSFDGFSPQTRLGHMHLNVGNLERSMAFYQTLGMDLMVGLAGQADFLSWDGYHHHLGVNLWNGRNARPVEPGAFGIDFYEIRHSGLQPATLQDPDGVTVIVS